MALPAFQRNAFQNDAFQVGQPLAAIARGFGDFLMMPPFSFIGNPNSVPSPASAITVTDLFTGIGAAVLTNTVLPSSVDLSLLPPQTVLGNSSDEFGGVELITFAALVTISGQVGLPTSVYQTYNPESVPPLTLIGNFSSGPGPAVPVAMGNVF